jgi:hypothetical protein
MTYIEPKIYELPSPGPHVAVLADELDLGTVNTIFGAKPQCKLIFLVDENGSDGRPLEVHVRATKTRNKRGNLYEFVEALCSPAPIGPDSWELSQHIGKSVGLDLVHAQKDDAVFCNVARVFPLGKTAPRLSIPLDYQSKGSGNSFAATPEPAPATPPAQPPMTDSEGVRDYYRSRHPGYLEPAAPPVPAAPPAAPSFPAKVPVKVVPAATTSATRAAAASAELAKRDKQARFETGQQEEAQVPLT